MTTVVMLRHGETEANRDRRIQGQNDTPLTASGILGITALADKLAGLTAKILITDGRETTPPGSDASHIRQPATTYCSPLPRARETLARLRTHLGWNGPITLDARLREIDFGDYTGRPVDDILPFIQHHKKNRALAYPGGESGADLSRRVMGFLDDIRTLHGGESVLVMAHFGPIETALRHYLNIPISERVWPTHDQVHRFDFGPHDKVSVTTL